MIDTECVQQSCTKIEYSCQSHRAVSLLPLDNVELKRNGKLRVTIDKHSECTSHRLKQLLCINEWDLDNSLPILFLPVEIELEVKRVELEDRRIRTVHQMLRRG